MATIMGLAVLATRTVGLAFAVPEDQVSCATWAAVFAGLACCALALWNALIAPKTAVGWLVWIDTAVCPFGTFIALAGWVRSVVFRLQFPAYGMEGTEKSCP
jgi:hypothetical protein